MVCQGSRSAPRSWDYLHNVCILSSRSCFIFIFEAQRGCWVFVWFGIFFLPLHATLFLGFSPATVSTTSPSHCSHHGPDEPPCARGGLLQKHEVPHHPQPHQCHAQHLPGGKEGRLEGGNRGPVASFGAERAAHPLWYHSWWHPGAVGPIIASFLGWDVFQDTRCDVWVC